MFKFLKKPKLQNKSTKYIILNTTIYYALSTKRFGVPLTNSWFVLKYLCFENMSFKFDYLNVNSFLQYYIVLGIWNLLCLVN